MDPKQQMETAKKFAKNNIVTLCTELKSWHDTALLPDGKLRELARMLPVSDPLPLAQNLVEYAAIEYVIGKK